jgi:signal transduction histidine kinase
MAQVKPVHGADQHHHAALDRRFGCDVCSCTTPRIVGSNGVSGMYERVGLVGGDLFIETAPGQGTTIIAEIPLP